MKRKRALCKRLKEIKGICSIQTLNCIARLFGFEPRYKISAFNPLYVMSFGFHQKRKNLWILLACTSWRFFRNAWAIFLERGAHFRTLNTFCWSLNVEHFSVIFPRKTVTFPMFEYGVKCAVLCEYKSPLFTHEIRDKRRIINESVHTHFEKYAHRDSNPGPSPC